MGRTPDRVRVQTVGFEVALPGTPLQPPAWRSLSPLRCCASRRRDLSAAIWRAHLGVAEVVLQKGKLFTHMGFMQGSKFYLHIEEALYMVDRANLLLFADEEGRGKRLLSLHEGYQLMVRVGGLAGRPGG